MKRAYSTESVEAAIIIVRFIGEIFKITFGWRQFFTAFSAAPCFIIYFNLAVGQCFIFGIPAHRALFGHCSGIAQMPDWMPVLCYLCQMYKWHWMNFKLLFLEKNKNFTKNYERNEKYMPSAVCHSRKRSIIYYIHNITLAFK